MVGAGLGEGAWAGRAARSTVAVLRGSEHGHVWGPELDSLMPLRTGTVLDTRLAG